MKKVLLALVGALGYALFSGFMAHGKFEESIAEGCSTTGQAPAGFCNCIAEAVSAEYSFITFVGVGPLRPFMDEAEMQSTAIRLAPTCQAEG